MKEQVRQLRMRSEKFADGLRRHILSTHEVWLALNRTFLPKIGYSLVTTTLSEEDHAKVMAPALNRALPNSKIQRNFPRSVLYGPEQYQGMGVENPYWVEGIEHIKAIVDEINGATDTGDLLQA